MWLSRHFDGFVVTSVASSPLRWLRRHFGGFVVTSVASSSLRWLRRHFDGFVVYTRKNARSVTAFNSTEIRSVQDNVATPVTATMVTVCISTDALSSVFISPDGLSSVFISPDLSGNNSFHQCCWSIMPVTTCSYRLKQSFPNIPVSFCYIRLIQP